MSSEIENKEANNTEPVASENDAPVAESLQFEFKTVTEPTPKEKLEAYQPKVKVDTDEEKAFKQGWRPKVEYKGEPSDWVDAKTYLDRGPGFKRIEKLNKRIEELSRINEQMQAAFIKAEERAYKKALSELEMQKNIAKNNNNVTAYEQVLQKEKEIKSDYKEAAENLNKPALDRSQEEILSSPEFKAFSTEHTWVHATDPMSNAIKSYAMALATEYAKEHPVSSVKDQLDAVSKGVFENFPNYPGFKNHKLNNKNNEGDSNDENEEIEDKGDLRPNKTLQPSIPNKRRSSPNEFSLHGKGLPETNEMEFARSTDHLEDGAKMIAEHMFRSGQDWKSYIKVVSKSVKRGK